MNVATTRPKLTEKQLRQQVLDVAAVYGYRVYFTWTSIHSPAGFPDLVLCNPVHRRVLFIELKTETGRVSPAQLEWIGDLRAAGAEVLVVRPADVDVLPAIFTRETKP